MISARAVVGADARLGSKNGSTAPFLRTRFPSFVRNHVCLARISPHERCIAFLVRLMIIDFVTGVSSTPTLLFLSPATAAFVRGIVRALRVEKWQQQCAGDERSELLWPASVFLSGKVLWNGMRRSLLTVSPRLSRGRSGEAPPWDALAACPPRSFASISSRRGFITNCLLWTLFTRRAAREAGISMMESDSHYLRPALRRGARRICTNFSFALLPAKPGKPIIVAWRPGAVADNSA